MDVTARPEDTEPQKGNGAAPRLEDAFFDTAPDSDGRAVVLPREQIERALRKALPVVGIIALVLLVALVIYAGPYTATRADGAEWVNAARESGAKLAAELSVGEPGPLHAAVGTLSIAPDPPNYVRLAGYGGIRKSVGLDGEVRGFSWVMRAGAGPSCVLLGADLLMFTPELVNAVATEVNVLGGIPRERIVFTASHTHSSVGGYGMSIAEGQLIGAVDFALLNLSMRLAPTAWGAVGSMRPAVIRAGQPTAPSLIHNRMAKDGPVDPTVDVLQLDVNAEEPALLVLFGGHPTTEPRRDWMSPDYPGPMRKMVSEHVGAFVSFAGGALGSMGVSSPLGERNPLTVGRMLSTPVMDAMRPRNRATEVTSSDVRVSCGRAPLPLPPPRVPVWGNLALTERATEFLVDPPESYQVSALVAGPVLLVSMPGELSGEVTVALRQRARLKGYVLSIASFAGEYAGYLLPAERYGQGIEAPLQLAGVGAAAPAVAFIEGLVDALPRGPVPDGVASEKVWPD